MRINPFTLIGVLAMAFSIMAFPVTANLVPTTFGFPVIVQNGSTSAFNQDRAQAVDIELSNIDFPLFGNSTVTGPLSAGGGGSIDGSGFGGGVQANILPFGPVNLSFPSMHQASIQAQDVTHTDFAQTNEYAEFAYPFAGVGAVSLPGFGFGF